MPAFETHLSRYARKNFGMDKLAFSSIGQARKVASVMKVSAADLYALGLIDDALRFLIQHYEANHPGLLLNAQSWLDLELGARPVKKTQGQFTDEFPPLSVYQGKVSKREYIESVSEGIPHKVKILKELLLLNLHNSNSAAAHLDGLFDDQSLKTRTIYPSIIENLKTFLGRQFEPGTNAEDLIRLLSSPAQASPHSLPGQLEYILNRWGTLLGEAFRDRLLRGLDLVREEIRRSGTGGFNGEVPLISFDYKDKDYERFSEDKDWMPHLVLIAKNSYVWLDQLSKWYARDIHRLDQIPEEELDKLAQEGITGLWLIGLWERSPASMRIKQIMGNPEAVASAYSLRDYQIATDLGGWDALNSLRGRAWQKGIRLSADMVPNHMGIDSRWVIEHPDWFLSLPYSPYPDYSFNGPDLSNDEGVGIFIEDHYYDKTDAAVVFKRLNRWTGEASYIYHGNDGTSMPWNDTAQLDYLKAEVREAVIQAILAVAHQFPIIRFDAAMTLARKHIQRLWFPEPGSGGAIPSRSEHGITRAQFDEAMPNEFWREVVDRVASEVPDTLLLAEAFWLMEGYFVCTLGMHRVYNSAFMHMLRDEDNAKYRQVMKNVLEFDPQVLKRFVNFMNNPDEKTAIEQFGDGDKYFGVCTLMSTLPGLPMFGHGQIEGFHEKYGMEYRRTYWNETPNDSLVRGHEWHIFPFLHRRYLFADVEHFLLYDFLTPDGHVNEDVFVYSNGYGSEQALVVYNNKFAEARGWVKTSVAFFDKTAGRLIHKTLSAGLGLHGDEVSYITFRDAASGLEYIRSSHEAVVNGLYLELGAYQRHVFLDIREQKDEDGRMSTLCMALNGTGVPSIVEKMKELFTPIKITGIEEERPQKARKTSPKKPAVRKKTRVMKEKEIDERQDK